MAKKSKLKNKVGKLFSYIEADDVDFLEEEETEELEENEEFEESEDIEELNGLSEQDAADEAADLEEADYEESGYEESNHDEADYDESNHDEADYDEANRDEADYDEANRDEADYDEANYDEDGYDEEDYDASGYDDTDYEDYFNEDYEDNKKQRKPSQLDILDDDYIKNNMMYKMGGKAVALIIAWIVFAILCGLYVYFFFIKKDNTNIVPGKDNTVSIEIPDGAAYDKCDIEEINTLITNYLIARVGCNQATLKSLVTDPTQFDDMSVLEQASQYVKGYNNTTCYIADGYDENSYIIIELSNLRISDVDSEPLDIMSFYIVKDTNGEYKINNSKLSDDVANFVSQVKASDDIQSIYIHVKENNDYLLDTDETFAAFYNKIK